MQEILYIIIVGIIFYWILHKDLQIDRYKSILRACLYALISVCILSYTTREGLYSVFGTYKPSTSNTCLGTFKESHNTTLTCKNPVTVGGATMCECSDDMGASCTSITGCYSGNNITTFNTIWKGSQENACRWASNQCDTVKNNFNNIQQTCYAYTMDIPTYITTPSNEIDTSGSYCDTNIGNLTDATVLGVNTDFITDCNYFNTKCIDCSGSGCVQLTNDKNTTVSSLGSGSAVSFDTTDAAYMLNFVGRAGAKKKKKAKKACKKIRDKCKQYLADFNEGVQSCYGTELNMSSFLALSDTSTLQTNCSNNWSTIKGIQQYCVDASFCWNGWGDRTWKKKKKK